MKLTPKELQFLDEYADLINNYSADEYVRIRQAITNSFEYRDNEKLLVLIHYLKYGSHSFILFDSSDMVGLGVHLLGIFPQGQTKTLCSYIKIKNSGGGLGQPPPSVTEEELRTQVLRKLLFSGLPEDIAEEISRNCRLGDDLRILLV